jgi:hypothetical protein
MRVGAGSKKKPQGEREVLLWPWGRDGGLLFILILSTNQAIVFISTKHFSSSRQPVSTAAGQSATVIL